MRAATNPIHMWMVAIKLSAPSEKWVNSSAEISEQAPSTISAVDSSERGHRHQAKSRFVPNTALHENFPLMIKLNSTVIEKLQLFQSFWKQDSHVDCEKCFCPMRFLASVTCLWFVKSEQNFRDILVYSSCLSRAVTESCKLNYPGWAWCICNALWPSSVHTQNTNNQVCGSDDGRLDQTRGTNQIITLFE